MTSPWATAHVDAELDWSNIDTELVTRLSRSAEIASRAVQRQFDQMERGGKRSFTRTGRSFEQTMRQMVLASKLAASQVNAHLRSIDNKVSVKVDVDAGSVTRLNAQLSALRDRVVSVRVDVDTGSAVADLAAAITTMQAYASANPISVNVGIDAAAAAAQLAALLAALQAQANANPIDIPVNPNGGLGGGGQSSIRRMSSLLTGIGSSALGAAGTFTKFATIAGTATIAVAGMMPAIAALGSSLIALASSASIAAGGAGIAGLSAAIIGFAGLKTGISGISDAFGAMGKSATSGGSASASAAKQVASATKQVESAERSLVRAVKDEKAAQLDVGRARDDARKKLRDLDLQLRGAALSEADAELSLKEARLDLATGEFATSIERERAVLRVQQAEQALTETRRDNADLVKDATDTRSKGVEGSDEVVAAQERLTDATQATKDAQESLNDARKALTDATETAAGGGSDPFAEALAKLSDNARAFVLAIKSVSGAWSDMKKGVQDRLFDGLAAEVQPLSDLYVPRLGDALGRVTDGFNLGAKSVTGFLKSTQGLSVMDTMFGTSSQMAHNFGVSLGNLVPGFAAVSAGAGQAFAPLTDGWGGATKRLSDYLIKMQETGQMEEFFTRAWETMKTVGKELGAVFGQLGGIISGVFSAAKEASGGNVLGGMLQTLTKVNEWVNGEGKSALVGFFESMQAALGAIIPIVLQVAEIIGTTIAPALSGLIQAIAPAVSGLVDAIGVGLQAIAPAMAPLGDAISSIAGALAPVMPVLGELSTKLVELAGPIIGALAQALGPVLTTVGEALISLLDALMPAVQPVADLFVALSPVLSELASLLGEFATTYVTTLLVPAIRLLAGTLTTIAPIVTGILQMLQPFVKALAYVAAGVVAAILAFKAFKVITTIIKAVRIAWTLLSLAFTLSPIGVIIAGVVAAGVALWAFFTKTETGRKWWNAIWGGIKAAVDVVVTWFKDTAWPWMQEAFKKIGDAAMWLWNNVITPAFEGIKRVISVWWTVVSTYFKIWWSIITNVVAPVVMWLWNNVIKPAWNGISASIKLAWNVIQIVFGAISDGIRIIANVVTWLWNNIVEPAWNGISAAISFAWENVIRPAWDLFRDGIDAIGKVVSWLWNDIVEPAWKGISGAISAAWDFLKPIFGKIGDGIKGIGDIAKKIGGGIKDAFRGVVGVLKTPVHWLGRLMKMVPKTIAKVPVPGVGTLHEWGDKLQALRSGGTVYGPGSGTSDSIIARLSNGEFVVREKMASRYRRLLELINSGSLGRYLPAFAAGGSVGYGLEPGSNISYGGKGFPDWVMALGKSHNVQPSTYPGHQESNRGEAGYAPNPNGLNRGIDWSGSVDSMQKFAEYLLSIAPSTPSLEQIIWQNPETGEKIGWAGGKPDTDGSYFANDYAGHQDHVHIRASGPVGVAVPKNAPSGTAPSTSTGSSSGVGSFTPIGSGTSGTTSSGTPSSGTPSWGNSGGASQYNSASEADAAGVVPVWVENWPAMMGGGGGAPLSTTSPTATTVPTTSSGKVTAPAGGGGLGKLTTSSSKDEVATAIYWEALRRGYTHDEAVALISTGLQESGLSPTASGGGGAWLGVYQQDGSYPGRTDPNENITAFLDRLDAKRKDDGASPDIWKNIFWLQQAPGISTADSAFAGGRQAYLPEIQSKKDEAAKLADAARKKGTSTPDTKTPVKVTTDGNDPLKVTTDDAADGPVLDISNMTPTTADGKKLMNTADTDTDPSTASNRLSPSQADIDAKNKEKNKKKKSGDDDEDEDEVLQVPSSWTGMIGTFLMDPLGAAVDGWINSHDVRVEKKTDDDDDDDDDDDGDKTGGNTGGKKKTADKLKTRVKNGDNATDGGEDDDEKEKETVVASNTLLGQHINSAAGDKSIGSRISSVGTTALTGQLSPFMDLFGIQDSPVFLQAINRYQQDNPRSKDTDGVTKRDLQDLLKDIAVGDVHVTVNGNANADEIAAKVQQGQREQNRKRRRYVGV